MAQETERLLVKDIKDRRHVPELQDRDLKGGQMPLYRRLPREETTNNKTVRHYQHHH